MPSLNDEALTSLIEKNDWWFQASEFHAAISACCAFNHSELAQALIAEPSAQALIEAMLSNCENTLQDNSLSYQLLLSDEENLSSRAESFVSWCQGFLLAYRFLSEQTQLSAQDEEIQQFLEQLAQFAELDTALENNEENAQALLELEEYCRLAVLMIYAQYHRSANESHNATHH